MQAALPGCGGLPILHPLSGTLPVRGPSDLSPVCHAAALHFDLWVPEVRRSRVYMGYSNKCLGFFPFGWRFEEGYMHRAMNRAISFDRNWRRRHPYDRRISSHDWKMAHCGTGNNGSQFIFWIVIKSINSRSRAKMDVDVSTSVAGNKPQHSSYSDEWPGFIIYGGGSLIFSTVRHWAVAGETIRGELGLSATGLVFCFLHFSVLWFSQLPSGILLDRFWPTNCFGRRLNILVINAGINRMVNSFSTLFFNAYRSGVLAAIYACGIKVDHRLVTKERGARRWGF